MPGFLGADGAHAPSWYAETALPGAAPPRPALRGAAQADVAIIGGGFAGLSTALHLAEAGVSVALIEAHRVGWGASGRNGGQLERAPRREVGFYEAALGREAAREALETAAAARDLVVALAGRSGADLQLRFGGLSLHHRRRLNAEAAREIAHLAEVYGVGGLTALTPEEARALCGAQGVAGGVRDARAGQIHPLRYAQALAAMAEAAGARLFERARARRIDLAAGRIEIDGGATLAADRIVLAVNGYHDGIAPEAAARTAPLNAFMIATAPLGARAREVLAEPLTAADTRFVINYFRLSPDGRLLFGGGESLRPRLPADLAARARRRMLRLFPQLADVEITHAWGGTLGVSATRAPVALRLAGGRALSIGGWSGSGVHMATMGGKIAADALTGAPARLEALAKVPTPPFPGGPRLRTPLLAAAMLAARLRDLF